MTLLTALLLLLAAVARSETFTATLSSALTLVTPVTYTLNYTFTARSIPASAYAVVALSNNFNLNASVLANCMFATTLASAYSATPCSLTTNSSGTLLTFPSIYPALLDAETLLSLMVHPQRYSFKYLTRGALAQRPSV
jgi:hypothetical protein